MYETALPYDVTNCEIVNTLLSGIMPVLIHFFWPLYRLVEV